MQAKRKIKEEPANIYKIYFKKLSYKKKETPSPKEEKNFGDQIARQEKFQNFPQKTTASDIENKTTVSPSGILSTQDFNMKFLDD